MISPRLGGYFPTPLETLSVVILPALFRKLLSLARSLLSTFSSSSTIDYSPEDIYPTPRNVVSYSFIYFTYCNVLLSSCTFIYLYFSFPLYLAVALYLSCHPKVNCILSLLSELYKRTLLSLPNKEPIHLCPLNV